MALDHRAGETIAGRYVLRDKLGAGAFGDVWEAMSANGPVAVKFVRTNSALAKPRFVREVRALQRLAHPYCVRLVDYGVLTGDRPFLVTDLIDGVSLDEWLSANPGPGEVLTVAQQICEGVEHAHSLGLLHRDLKPQNIMVEQRSGGPNVRILDFGIVRIAGLDLPDVTKTGEVIGTAGYMSPEQLRGSRSLSAASDVYALGVILFELFERRPPFDAGSALEISMKHLLEPPPALGVSFSNDLRSLVGDMLAKDPGARPPLHVVRRVLEGASYRSRRPATEAPERRAPRSTVVVIAVVTSIVAVLVLWSLSPLLRTEPPPDPIRPTIKDRPTLVRDESAPAVPKPTVVGDAGQDVSRAADTYPNCGPNQKTGLTSVVQADMFEQREVSAFLPSSYGKSPLPVVVVLHDIAQLPESLLAIPELQAAAEDTPFVMVAPADPGIVATWTDAGDHENAAADVKLAVQSLCVDPDRIFVIGHGNGGLAAEQLGCSMNGVRAIAQTSHRYWGKHVPCTDRTVPRLLVLATEDPGAPADGSKACQGLGDLADFVRQPEDGDMRPWSIEDEVKRLRKDYGCRGGSRAVNPYGEGVCATSKCDQLLWWCEAAGGRDWSSMPPRRATQLPRCASEPSRFDHARQVFEFFDKVGGLEAPPN